MNDNERFEMLMEGVLLALLEIPQGDDVPRSRSVWTLTDRLAELRSA
ncbi:MAG: hypothetical protein AAF081_05385 [Actinomycetota bacterium]